MPSFSPIRDIPSGISEWEYAVLAAVKDNVEILCGGKGDGHAVLNSNITATLDTAKYQQMLAQGGGFTIPSGAENWFTDYQGLVRTVINLAADVQSLRSTVSTLIQQLQK